MAKRAKTSKGKKLPAKVAKKLDPFIQRGIQNGLWDDPSAITDMFAQKIKDERIKETLDTLGGIKTEVGQMFVADALLVDLSAILRQKKYTAHIQVWEVDHRTIPTAGGDRLLCGVFGQAVIEDLDGSVLDPGLFNCALWGEDAALGDDLERDGVYSVSVTCRDLETDVLDLRPMAGLSRFKDAKFDGFTDRCELLQDTFEVSEIADLEDNVSRGRNDYRLVEGTVSFAGVKARRDGGTFGSLLLKDDSTTTLEAIESGETLLLSGITNTAIANRFGKYSKILALCTVKNDGQYGLSANVVAAEGLVIVAPPKPVETNDGDDSDDDAATYFSDLDDDDDEDEIDEVDVEDDDEADEEDYQAEADKAEAEIEEAEAEEADDEEWVEGEDESDEEAEDESEDESEDETEDDDDWDDWGDED